MLGGGSNYSANVVCGTVLVKMAASDTLDVRAYTSSKRRFHLRERHELCDLDSDHSLVQLIFFVGHF